MDPHLKDIERERGRSEPCLWYQFWGMFMIVHVRVIVPLESLVRNSGWPLFIRQLSASLQVSAGPSLFCYF